MSGHFVKGAWVKDPPPSPPYPLSTGPMYQYILPKDMAFREEDEIVELEVVRLSTHKVKL